MKELEQAAVTGPALSEGLGSGGGGRDYARMLTEGYAAFASTDPIGRLEYLSDYIFDFTTYDDEMAELFARRALEVCAAISNSTTFDYIKDAAQYRWYLVMCNMPFFADKIEWGPSVRGAWWGEPPQEKIKFDSCGLWLDGEQLHEPMDFTRDQWREFIAAVLAFGSEEPNVRAEAGPTAKRQARVVENAPAHCAGLAF